MHALQVTMLSRAIDLVPMKHHGPPQTFHMHVPEVILKRLISKSSSKGMTQGAQDRHELAKEEFMTQNVLAEMGNIAFNT